MRYQNPRSPSSEPALALFGTRARASSTDQLADFLSERKISVVEQNLTGEDQNGHIANPPFNDLQSRRTFCHEPRFSLLLNGPLFQNVTKTPQTRHNPQKVAAPEYSGGRPF
jgi:hypothetical protein